MRPLLHLFSTFLLIYVAYFLWIASVSAAVPNVVVTIKPIHSLVSNVMAGIGEPHLLLPDGASPHTFSLKPSMQKQLRQADCIIWVGPALENFMQKSLLQKRPQARLLTLLEISDLHTLPQRRGNLWETHDPHDHGLIDPHIWLSTENATRIVQAIMHLLMEIDPEHAVRYQHNAQKTSDAIASLAKKLQEVLHSQQGKSFLVYHDSFQYFEAEFHLKAQGSLMLGPHLPTSALRLQTLQKMIQHEHIRCFFKDTEFPAARLPESLRKLPITIVELDPLGIAFPPGPQHYFQTLLQLSNRINGCLNDPELVLE